VRLRARGGTLVTLLLYEGEEPPEKKKEGPADASASIDSNCPFWLTSLLSLYNNLNINIKRYIHFPTRTNSTPGTPPSFIDVDVGGDDQQVHHRL
jgi:hypothetical protein